MELTPGTFGNCHDTDGICRGCYGTNDSTSIINQSRIEYIMFVAVEAAISKERHKSENKLMELTPGTFRNCHDTDGICRGCYGTKDSTSGHRLDTVRNQV